MSPDRDLGRRDDDGREVDPYAEEAPRSLFSALWFRALLVVIVLGIVAAIAVPYLLDVATSPSLKTATKAVPVAPSSPAGAPSATAPTAAPVAPATPATSTAATPATTGAAPAASGTTPTAPAATAAAPAATAAAPTTKAAASSTASPAPPPSAPVAKPPVKAAKVAEAPKQTTTKSPASKPSSVKAATVAATGGPYWVQVGAFKEAETAKRLAARLREQGLSVEESTTGTVAPRPPTEAPASGSAGDRYDVVVSGASAADLDAKIAPKGMTGETTPNGIVVRPSLPLREAVALSRDLADSGMIVQVRRVGGPAPVAAPAPAPAPAGGVALHRVRIGGFPDRATAVAAAKQLEEKGYKTFIARRGE